VSAPAIEVSDLTKRFGERTVVDRVSLSVAKGEIAGFLGPNGSGKTTTIRLMCGLLQPDGGSGRVLGHDILTERGAIKREVGYMTQKFSFYEDLTIEENLSFVAGLYQMRRKREVVRDTLRDLGLWTRRGQLAGALSGGWKQRLALAACVMHKPRLLMLDEPSLGLAPLVVNQMFEVISRINKSGTSVLLAEQNAFAALKIAHRAYVIESGRIVLEGDRESLMNNEAVRRAYIGA